MLRFDLNGGDSRVRTGDLLLARQALSQLSYIPGSALLWSFLVGLSGLEPPTLRLSVVRSSQLSYRPSSSEETPLHPLRPAGQSSQRSVLPPLPPQTLRWFDSDGDGARVLAAYTL